MIIRPSVILFLIICIGLTLYSLRLPYYTDIKAKEKLEMDVNDTLMSNMKSYAKIKDTYYQDIEKLKTNKTFYFDLGSGLSVASFIILLFLLVYRIKYFSDFIKVKSFNKTLIYLTAIPVWLLMIPGIYWYYSFRGERGDYPMFADSIFIPIVEGTLTVIVGLFVLVIFLIATTYKSVFPTYLFIKYNTYNNKMILREILWAVLLLLNLICFILFIIGGDHVSIIVNLFFTYLILVLRAGQINAYNIRLC